jgi:hypothetical protein
MHLIYKLKWGGGDRQRQAGSRVVSFDTRRFVGMEISVEK